MVPGTLSSLSQNPQSSDAVCSNEVQALRPTKTGPHAQGPRVGSHVAGAKGRRPLEATAQLHGVAPGMLVSRHPERHFPARTVQGRFSASFRPPFLR